MPELDMPSIATLFALAHIYEQPRPRDAIPIKRTFVVCRWRVRSVADRARLEHATTQPIPVMVSS
jgi:hypothetical protein